MLQNNRFIKQRALIIRILFKRIAKFVQMLLPTVSFIIIYVTLSLGDGNIVNFVLFVNINILLYSVLKDSSKEIQLDKSINF
jgi:hypothetical protein